MMWIVIAIVGAILAGPIQKATGWPRWAAGLAAVGVGAVAYVVLGVIFLGSL